MGKWNSIGEFSDGKGPLNMSAGKFQFGSLGYAFDEPSNFRHTIRTVKKKV